MSWYLILTVSLPHLYRIIIVVVNFPCIWEIYICVCVCMVSCDLCFRIQSLLFQQCVAALFLNSHVDQVSHLWGQLSMFFTVGSRLCCVNPLKSLLKGLPHFWITTSLSDQSKVQLGERDLSVPKSPICIAEVLIIGSRLWQP